VPLLGVRCGYLLRTNLGVPCAFTLRSLRLNTKERSEHLFSTTQAPKEKQSLTSAVPLLGVRCGYLLRTNLGVLCAFTLRSLRLNTKGRSEHLFSTTQAPKEKQSLISAVPLLGVRCGYLLRTNRG